MYIYLCIYAYIDISMLACRLVVNTVGGVCTGKLARQARSEGRSGRHDFVLAGLGLSETKRTKRANAKPPTYGEKQHICGGC